MTLLHQLAATERLYLAAGQARSLVLITATPGGAIVDWSAGAEAMLGWRAPDIAGEPLATIFTEEDVAAGVPAREMARAAALGTAPDTRWMARSDGGRVFVECELTALRTPDGALAGFVKVLRDATAMLYFQRSEANLRALVNATPHMVWCADGAGSGDYFNDKMLAYTGQPMEALLGHGWTALVHPDDQAGTWEAWMAANARRAALSIEFRFRHVSGEYRWVLCRGEPVLDPATGEVLRWMGTNTEIHEHKVLTDDLALANRRQREFLATLAHELRNPLAPICNALEVLRMAGDDPVTVARLRDMMGRQVDHLVHLVEDLLDLARVASGKIELKRGEVVLQAVVAHAVEAVAPVLRERRHSFTCDVPEAPVRLFADPHRLVQVIVNLLTNAAKYTPEGGMVSLRAWREGGHAVVAVADNGIGIASAELPHLFDMFSQVDEAAELSQGGLGIGLNLVKRLAEKHGGSVEAASGGSGKGATFTLRLPVDRRRE